MGRGLALTATRRADQVMPDPVEHATGLEKYELLAKLAGNEDPFFLRAVTRGKGTKENPTIINAMDNYRMVGCVCVRRTPTSSGPGSLRVPPRGANVDSGWS